VEIQVFADRHGNVIHLFERDCSIQRRHQKVVEEAPSPAMTPALSQAMGEAAVAAARSIGYVGAGTVEFIASASPRLKSGGFWFMEMNTRLQVEHPVTEEVTGLDLVAWQFRVAADEKLPLVQEQVRFDGHAIEARVYAEDPEHGFLPSTGPIVGLDLPADVRVDSGVEAGGVVTPFYDPMIAKLIVHATSRAAALDRMTGALDRTLVAGVRSNVAFLSALCRAPHFREGRVDTGFIDRHLAALGAVPHDQPIPVMRPASLQALSSLPIAAAGQRIPEISSDVDLVEFTVNAQGQGVSYEVLSGTPDRDTLRELDHVLLFSHFRPQLSFGRPTAGGHVIVRFDEFHVKG